ncbi:MAG: stage II sporulation protein P [Firmicutes bacterium]|nr:stage II sporulation protein P [Bacillota bacterium]
MNNRKNRRRRPGSRTGTRHIFNIMAWTASFLMVITMLPAESPAAQQIAKLQEAAPVFSLNLEELAAGPDDNIKTDTTATADENPSEAKETAEVTAVVTADKLENQKEIKTVTSNVTGKGNILIYHTHATEAYKPLANTSTHSTDASGTVREAGTTLTNALKAKGFSVVHDGTLHDSPSYNKSYNRSLETAKSLLSQYGDVEMIIDMHRDAASSSNGKAKTVEIGGQTVASFSLVVGTGNENYNEIRAFAEKIVNKANEMYPGFATGIIERPYKFNGYLSDRYILLELGNDANTIDQVNTSAIYLADVFANTLKDL